jgi:hypothetical protein
MKIIEKYLVVRFGSITEVVKLENGSYYFVLPNMKGVNYEEVDPETFYQLRDESKTIL